MQVTENEDMKHAGEHLILARASLGRAKHYCDRDRQTEAEKAIGEAEVHIESSKRAIERAKEAK